jgi:hypothetical protein
MLVAGLKCERVRRGEKTWREDVEGSGLREECKSVAESEEI